MEQGPRRNVSTLTTTTVAVGAVLAVTVGGLVGLTVDRDEPASTTAAAPAAPAEPAQTAAHVVAQSTPPTQNTQAPAADPATEAPEAPGPLATPSNAGASSTPAPDLAPAPVVAQVAGASNAMVAGGGGLFDGAVFAAGARSAPSRGGVRLSTPARGALSGRTIVVDAGHNGRSNARINGRAVPDGTGGTKACNTTGTSTNGGYSEHAHNWAVATKLAATLRARGARVVLTRPTDGGIGPCVDERAAIGNRYRADLVLSIHADGAAASARGFHVIRSTRMAGGAGVTARSARAAALVRDAFAQVTGRPRSTYLGGGTGVTPRRDIAGVNLSRVPAVMLEAGNMRNPTEARLLSSRAFQQREAAALALAAQRFLAR
ncbi:N-acetylmuramoyl-L-alanine amidase [Agilicoccus flavus]|uniref:N-acetylmuramoyl-L-alanine amidase n=1 Tax=Agilicoccus flavus TaxID=2775968 RepID=UPI001CF6B0E3|nr:N-acetylmuramoyl-L-alanine amidase [Agilicoccus flavus]